MNVINKLLYIAAAIPVILFGCGNKNAAEMNSSNYTFDVVPAFRFKETVKLLGLGKDRRYTAADITEIANAKDYYVNHGFQYISSQYQCPSAETLIGTKQIQIDTTPYNDKKFLARTFVLIQSDDGFVECIEARWIYRD